MKAISRFFRFCFWVGLSGGLAAVVLSLVLWQRDRSELDRVIEKEIAGADGAPSAKMRAAVQYIRANVDYGRPDEYFLLPLFRPLKPTARQVIEHGGDCAYRARALIVMLDLMDVPASKLALYNEGESVHAAVRVETEKGDYIVDMLFNVIHEDESGAPLSLEDLAQPETLAASLARARAAGNEAVDRYEDQYHYRDVRTFNWEKSSLMRAAYKALAWVGSEEWVDSIERPYITEEPALMVAAASGAGAGFCGLALALGAWRRRRKARYQQMPL